MNKFNNICTNLSYNNILYVYVTEIKIDLIKCGSLIVRDLRHGVNLFTISSISIENKVVTI